MTNFSIGLGTGFHASGSLEPVSNSVGTFFVQPDQYTRHWSYKVRPAALAGSAPAVFRTGPINNPDSLTRCIFGSAWQWYAFDLLSWSAFGKTYRQTTPSELEYLKQAFNSLYAGNRAFTNYNGVDTCKNFITGETAGRDNAMIDSLICAGNLVQGEKVRNDKGVWMVKLRSFRVGNAPPSTVDLKDSRVQKATVIYSDGHLGNFPQLDSKTVFYPFVTGGQCYYQLEELLQV